jgi:hypothetical protein
LADVFPREEFGHAERDRTLDAVGDHLRLDVVEADMLGEKVGALGGRYLFQNRENQVALAREQVYPAILRQHGRKFRQDVVAHQLLGREVFPECAPPLPFGVRCHTLRVYLPKRGSLPHGLPPLSYQSRRQNLRKQRG